MPVDGANVELSSSRYQTTNTTNRLLVPSVRELQTCTIWCERKNQGFWGWVVPGWIHLGVHFRILKSFCPVCKSGWQSSLCDCAGCCRLGGVLSNRGENAGKFISSPTLLRRARAHTYTHTQYRKRCCPVSNQPTREILRLPFGVVSGPSCCPSRLFKEGERERLIGTKRAHGTGN